MKRKKSKTHQLAKFHFQAIIQHKHEAGSLPKTTTEVTELWGIVGAGCHRKLNTREVSLLTELSGGSRVKWHCLKAECKVTLSLYQTKTLRINVISLKWHFQSKLFFFFLRGMRSWEETFWGSRLSVLICQNDLCVNS